MTGFDFTAKLNFGQLTEMQTKKLNEAFSKHDYDNVVALPVMQVFDDKKGSQIIVNPDQFIFKVTRPYEKKEIDTYIKILQKGIEALMGSNSSEICNCRFVNIYESAGTHADEILRTKTTYDLNDEKLRDVAAVGYRFLLKGEDFYDEIKVEPLLRNLEAMFIEGIFNKKNITFENVEDYIKSAYCKYDEKVNFFIN